MSKQFELDHVFILTNKIGAPEADKLMEFGLVEGPPNIHPGQVENQGQTMDFCHHLPLRLCW
ncbi:hypothetical protein QGP82_33595 [Leptothoe sp. LEGE 181152]|nr:hypothetical protein [Leptothoe sp. LEGE 181152]